VDPWARGRPHGLTGEIDVPLVTPGKAGDDGAANASAIARTPRRSPSDALGTRLRSRPPQRIQLAGETQLLLGCHRIAGRLLAVAQVVSKMMTSLPMAPLPSRMDGEKKTADLLGPRRSLRPSCIASCSCAAWRAPQTLF